MIKHKFYKPEDIEEFSRKTSQTLTAITDQLIYYRYAYYVKATPVITDREYDAIEGEFLKTLRELKSDISALLTEVDSVSSDRAEDYAECSKIFDHWLTETK